MLSPKTEIVREGRRIPAILPIFSFLPQGSGRQKSPFSPPFFPCRSHTTLRPSRRSCSSWSGMGTGTSILMSSSSWCSGWPSAASGSCRGHRSWCRGQRSQLEENPSGSRKSGAEGVAGSSRRRRNEKPGRGIVTCPVKLSSNETPGSGKSKSQRERGGISRNVARGAGMTRNQAGSRGSRSLRNTGNGAESRASSGRAGEGGSPQSRTDEERGEIGSGSRRKNRQT